MVLGRLIILWIVAFVASIGAFFLWDMSFWASVGVFYLAGFTTLAVMYALFLLSENRPSTQRDEPDIEKQTA